MWATAPAALAFRTSKPPPGLFCSIFFFFHPARSPRSHYFLSKQCKVSWSSLVTIEDHSNQNGNLDSHWTPPSRIFIHGISGSKTPNCQVTLLFLSIRTTGSLLPACQDLAGASEMLQEQDSAGTSRNSGKCATSRERLLFSGHVGTESSNKEWLSWFWIDSCVSRTVYAKPLSVSLPGLK